MADFAGIYAPAADVTPLALGSEYPEYAGVFAANVTLSSGSAPSITNFVPALGPIDRLQPLQLDVLDDSGLIAAFILMVGFSGSFPTDAVYLKVPGKAGFCGRYQGVVSNVTGGIRLASLKRLGGWPDAPHFYAYPLDAAGNLG